MGRAPDGVDRGAQAAADECSERRAYRAAPHEDDASADDETAAVEYACALAFQPRREAAAAAASGCRRPAARCDAIAAAEWRGERRVRNCVRLSTRVQQQCLFLQPRVRSSQQSDSGRRAMAKGKGKVGYCGNRIGIRVTRTEGRPWLSPDRQTDSQQTAAERHKSAHQPLRRTVTREGGRAGTAAMDSGDRGHTHTARRSSTCRSHGR